MIVTQEQSLKVYIPDVELVEVLRKANYPFPSKCTFKLGYLAPMGPGVTGGLVIEWSRTKRVKG